MATLTPAFQAVPEFLPDDVEHRRQLAQQGNLLLQGKMNVFIDFTLTANVASSTLQDPRISYYSTILWMPTTANAAAEIGAGGMYVSALTTGSATITHANNGNTDRTFRMVILG